MKRSLHLLFLFGLLSAFQVNAQNNFFLFNATVTDSLGNPVPGFTVLIDPDGLGGNGGNVQSAISDSFGFIESPVFLDTGITSTPAVSLVYFSCSNPLGVITLPLGPASVGDTLFASILSDCSGSGGTGTNCTAGFTFLAFGDTVQFNNTSTGSANLSYHWDFGDGTVSTAMNPTHIYPIGGFYTVCLTITDSLAGCFDVQCSSVNVSTPAGCAASFVFQPNGLDVSFINTTSGLPFFFGDSFWDFGDGNTGFGNPISHTYAQPGTYNVIMIYSDTLSGCTDTTAQLVTVSNSTTCAADFTFSASNDTVSFTNASTGASNLNYFWDFGDNTTSTAANPVHIYPALGTYSACLTITDSANTCVDTKCVLITLGSPNSFCQAGFFFQTYGDTVQFVDFSFSTNPTAQLDYLWDFGDGDSSTLQNPVHVYPGPGTYNACLLIFEPTTGCTSDTCLQVVIGNTPSTCDASFFFTDLGSGFVQFFNASNLPYSSEFWDFGDGNTSTQANPIHQYANSGAYVVTRIVSSSTATGLVCSDTMVSVIAVNTTGPGCFADFSVQYDTIGNGSLTFDVINPLPGNTYTWDLGDGTTGTGTTLTHTYATTGSYTVCLVAADSFGCVDTMCKVIPSMAPPAVFGVLGFVNLSANIPATDFTAYLIVLDSAAGTLTAVDTFVSDPSLGPFFFFGAPNGDYRVKVALNPGDPSYASFLPTYYGDDPLWSNATVVNQNTFPLLDITMVPGTNPGGPGFIGGLISQGANRTKTNMVEGIAVMLMDMNDNPVDYAVTNVSGEYSFDNIAEGSYKLMVDMWGKATEYYVVEIKAGQTQVTGLNFEFNDVQVWKTGVTTSTNPGFEEIARVYPNPATNVLNVELDLEAGKEIRIFMTNTMGQEVMQKTDLFQAGSSRTKLDLGRLPKGMYQISIFEGGKPLMSERILIK